MNDSTVCCQNPSVPEPQRECRPNGRRRDCLSPRLGHTPALMLHWSIIHYRRAAALPPRLPSADWFDGGLRQSGGSGDGIKQSLYRSSELPHPERPARRVRCKSDFGIFTTVSVGFPISTFGTRFLLPRATPFPNREGNFPSRGIGGIQRGSEDSALLWNGFPVAEVSPSAPPHGRTTKGLSCLLAAARSRSGSDSPRFVSLFPRATPLPNREKFFPRAESRAPSRVKNRRFSEKSQSFLPKPPLYTDPAGRAARSTELQI